jgi:glycerol-1-phosphate dehydrogenase [NAD(P)+]
VKPDVLMVVGDDAVRALIDYCRTLDTPSFTLVSDPNTYAALGQQVEAALRQAGLRVLSLVLTGDEIIADEAYLMRVMVQTPPGDQTYIAVGTGTITDIVRYVSFRTRNPFIAVPTAPSVDGFVSIVAPLVVGGIKETFTAQGPLAVFADLKTSIQAPPPLKAAGFGDMAGKWTSLADWKLGHLLWDEPYDAEIDRRVRAALDSCVAALDDLAQNSERGARVLMEALIESGMCMLEFGDSRPASGAEHHASHYWELLLLRTQRRAVLHGAKVGYATTLIAKLYEQVRAWSREDVAARLDAARLPDTRALTADIRAAYGSSADLILPAQQPFLEMTPARFDALKARIIDQWPAIQDLAAHVPPAAEIASRLRRAGGPTDPQVFGLTPDEILPALRYGHYLRDRFTVLKLMQICGVDVATLI